jgi:hypothetical protein
MKTITQTPVCEPASSCVMPAFFFAAPIDQNMRLWAWEALPGGLIEVLCADHH